MSCRT